MTSTTLLDEAEVQELLKNLLMYLAGLPCLRIMLILFSRLENLRLSLATPVTRPNDKKVDRCLDGIVLAIGGYLVCS